jgi:hypothetical protein
MARSEKEWEGKGKEREGITVAETRLVPSLPRLGFRLVLLRCGAIRKYGGYLPFSRGSH